MNENRKDIFKRNRLTEVVPLLTPYKINIDVANACNFKCNFCFHAIDVKELKKSGFKPSVMDYDLFIIIIQQIKEFPKKIKCIGLAGIGEPLLNKRLPEMIQLTKEYNVADKVVITTNGSLLTPEFSESLIDAGLDEIIISIEALDDKKYYDITGAKVNFEDIIDNIRFFYENKGNCKVFVKIMNIALDEKNDQEKFHEIFDNITDMAYVEQIIPQFKSVNYEKFNTNYDRTLYGKCIKPIEVCPILFYTIQIATSGNICPCCVDYNETVVFGDVKAASLKDIWNGREYNKFRKIHLNNKRGSIELCHNCDYLNYNVRDEDILDGAQNKILDKLGQG